MTVPFVRDRGLPKRDLPPIPTLSYSRFNYLTFDLGVAAQLSTGLFATYMSLMRCIWRGTTSVPEELQEHINRRLLVTYCCRDRVTRDTGLSRRQIFNHLQTLQRIGWIRIHKFGRESFYELGEVRQDQSGKDGEAYYQDGWMLALNRWLMEFGHGELPPESEMPRLVTHYLEDILKIEDKLSQPTAETLRGYTDLVEEYDFPFGIARLDSRRVSLIHPKYRGALPSLTELTAFFEQSFASSAGSKLPRLVAVKCPQCGGAEGNLLPRTGTLTLLENSQLLKPIANANTSAAFPVPGGEGEPDQGERTTVASEEAEPPPSSERDPGGVQSPTAEPDEVEQRTGKIKKHIARRSHNSVQPIEEEAGGDSAVQTAAEMREAAWRNERPAFTGKKSTFKRPNPPAQQQRYETPSRYPAKAAPKEEVASPELEALETTWREYYALVYPDYVCPRWDGKEKAKIQEIMFRFKQDHENYVSQTKALIVYGLLAWHKVRPKHFETADLNPHILNAVCNNLAPRSYDFGLIASNALSAWKAKQAGTATPGDLQMLARTRADFQSKYQFVPEFMDR